MTTAATIIGMVRDVAIILTLIAYALWGPSQPVAHTNSRNGSQAYQQSEDPSQ